MDTTTDAVCALARAARLLVVGDSSVEFVAAEVARP